MVLEFRDAQLEIYLKGLAEIVAPIVYRAATGASRLAVLLVRDIEAVADRFDEIDYFYLAYNFQREQHFVDYVFFGFHSGRYGSVELVVQL